MNACAKDGQTGAVREALQQAEEAVAQSGGAKRELQRGEFREGGGLHAKA